MKDITHLNDTFETEYNEIMDRETEDHVAGYDDYFAAKADGEGISGDDVNRRLRERRLGFKAPSEDWKQSHLIVRAIYPGQWFSIETETMPECIVWDLAGIRAMHVVPGNRPEDGAGVPDDINDPSCDDYSACQNCPGDDCPDTCSDMMNRRDIDRHDYNI